MNKKQQLKKELNAQGAAEITLVDADIVEQKGTWSPSRREEGRDFK